MKYGSRPTSVSMIAWPIRMPTRRQQHAGAGGQAAQHQRLDEQLRDEPAAAGAERRPDRDLALARRGARVNQDRDIERHDQQQQADDELHHARTPTR